MASDTPTISSLTLTRAPDTRTRRRGPSTTAFVKQTERVGTLSIALDGVTDLLVSQTIPFDKRTNRVVPLSPAIDNVTTAIVAHLDPLVSPTAGSVPVTIPIDPLTTAPDSPWPAIEGLKDGSIAPFSAAGTNLDVACNRPGRTGSYGAPRFRATSLDS